MNRRESCRRPVVVPSVEQVHELAAAAPDAATRAFTLVGAFSGLRLFEIGRLRREDFDSVGTLIVSRGKGGYEGEASLLYEPGLGALDALLAGAVGDRWIWQTPRGNAWDRRFVWRWFSPLAREVGFGGTFHALRHFHACWLLDRGAAVLDVSTQLRHHDNGELVRRRYGRMRSVEASLRRLDGLR